MKKFPFFISVFTIILTSIPAAYAWNNPTANPTGGAGVIYAESGTPANSFYIKSNGNVGIGTTNPTDLLYVNAVANSGNGVNIGGVFKLRNSTGSNHFVLEHLATTGDLYMRSDSDGVGVDTGNIIINDQGGNVGIGTTGPTEKLDVTGNIRASGTITATSFSGGLSGTVSAANVSAGAFGANTGGGNYTFPANVRIGGTPVDSNVRLQLSESGQHLNMLTGKKLTGTWPPTAEPLTMTLQSSGSSAGNLAFATGNTEIMRVTLGGNVGIGTTNPQSNLHILSNNSDNALRIEATTTPSVTLYSAFNDVNNRNWGIRNSYNAYGMLEFTVSSAQGTAPTSPKMVISRDGNVGVGTTAPAGKLDVRWPGDFDTTQAVIVSTAAQNPSVRLYRPSGTGSAYPWYIRAGSSAVDNLEFASGPATATIGSETVSAKVVLAASGNVGIGATTPSAGLDVQKAITAATGIANGTNLQQTLTAAANNDVLSALRVNPTFTVGAFTGVTQYAINATGTIKATAFEGGLSGTVTAANVSSGNFGANTGGGNYTFPANIGIGMTTAPGARLDVLYNSVGVTAVNSKVVSANTTGATFNTTAAVLTNYTGYLTNTSARSAGLNDLTNVGLYVSASGAQKNYAAIFDQGDVGIGITNPLYKLDVASAGALTARIGSASTDTVFIGGGAGKLNVGTIDPIYTIGTKRYATYVSAMTGVKEETSGTIRLKNTGDGYFAELNIKSAEEGDDLWLFYQTTDFGEYWDKLSILLSPSFEGNIWYEKDPSGKIIRVYGKPRGSTPALIEASYRLTAPRFDHNKWSNRSTDEAEGFKLNVKE